jgi:hypothetical protein
MTDYSEKARELLARTVVRGGKKSLERITTALQQAEAEGFERGRGEVAKQKRIVEIKTQALKRYAPCPDHGGKAQGGCLLCRAEAAERQISVLPTTAQHHQVCCKLEDAEAEVERLKTELDFFNDYVPELKAKVGRLKEILDGIEWRSCEKDNMEFEAKITCFTRDKIRAALEDNE